MAASASMRDRKPTRGRGGKKPTKQMNTHKHKAQTVHEKHFEASHQSKTNGVKSMKNLTTISPSSNNNNNNNNNKSKNNSSSKKVSVHKSADNTVLKNLREVENNIRKTAKDDIDYPTAKSSTSKPKCKNIEYWEYWEYLD